LPGKGVLIEGREGTVLVRVGFEGQAPARGIRREIALELSTRAPYQLCERRRRMVLPIELVVHPRLLPEAEVEAALVAATGSDARLAGEGGSLRDLRPWAAGDNPRHVHWRASARTGELQVRRFHSEVRP